MATTYGHTDIHTYIHTYRHTYRQTDRQTEPKYDIDNPQIEGVRIKRPLSANGPKIEILPSYDSPGNSPCFLIKHMMKLFK